MKVLDHKLLAEYIISQNHDFNNKKEKLAFIIGAMEPDINPMTYIRAVRVGNPFKSHFAKALEKKIEKLSIELAAKEEFTTKDFFKLGQLTHFVADTFTYPHNANFDKNMFKHAKYERNELHPALKKTLEKNHEGIAVNKHYVFEMIMGRHKAYMENEAGVFNDINHIVKINLGICKALIPVKVGISEANRVVIEKIA